MQQAVLERPLPRSAAFDCQGQSPEMPPNPLLVTSCKVWLSYSAGRKVESF
jgi:hypothetical protein